jgi:hypothetical protein
MLHSSTCGASGLLRRAQFFSLGDWGYLIQVSPYGQDSRYVTLQAFRLNSFPDVLYVPFAFRL